MTEHIDRDERTLTTRAVIRPLRRRLHRVDSAETRTGFTAAENEDRLFSASGTDEDPFDMPKEYLMLDISSHTVANARPPLIYVNKPKSDVR